MRRAYLRQDRVLLVVWVFVNFISDDPCSRRHLSTRQVSQELKCCFGLFVGHHIMFLELLHEGVDVIFQKLVEDCVHTNEASLGQAESTSLPVKISCIVSSSMSGRPQSKTFVLKKYFCSTAAFLRFALRKFSSILLMGM